MDSAIEFKTVGPEGGPLDEPADSSGETSGNLTLSDAVRRAVTSDPGLQAALARVRIAMAEADQSRLLPNPVLNVVLRWGPGKPQIEASLAQDFVQALQIPRRASAADNRLRQAAADAVTTAIDLASETQERYAAAQASASLVPLLRERLGLLDRLEGVAKAKLDAGEGTRSDLTVLQAQRVELQVEIDQAVLVEREERLRLARLVGEPSSAARWTLDRWAAPTIDMQTESRWIDAALIQRPEVLAIAWRLKALGDDEALVRLLPWEGASAGIDVQRDDKFFAGPSVSTPIPIFDTGQARRARVTAEQIEARHDLTLAKRKIVEEVRVAYSTLTASAANLTRIRSELIPLQEQRRTLAENAYTAGQTDVTALFLAEQDLRVAQARAIDVERQAALALVRLERAVGGPGVMARLSKAPAADSTTPIGTSAIVSKASPVGVPAALVTPNQ
ncbi:MAG: TolC family protein [Phycisphaerales bacterium]